MVRQTWFGACRKVFIVMEPRLSTSVGQGNVWNQIAVVALIIRNSKSIKKSMRDRLTLRHKAKIHQEENATGITCEQTELVQALKEIIWQEKLADEKKLRGKGKRKEEGEAQGEHMQSTMERLGQTVKRHLEHFVDWNFLCLHGKLVRLSNFLSLNNVLGPVFSRCSSSSMPTVSFLPDLYSNVPRGRASGFKCLKQWGRVMAAHKAKRPILTIRDCEQCTRYRSDGIFLDCTKTAFSFLQNRFFQNTCVRVFKRSVGVWGERKFALFPVFSLSLWPLPRSWASQKNTGCAVQYLSAEPVA